jgi:hypothetical protein
MCGWEEVAAARNGGGWSVADEFLQMRWDASVRSYVLLLRRLRGRECTVKGVACLLSCDVCRDLTACICGQPMETKLERCG